jgi:hypothetical protein
MQNDEDDADYEYLTQQRTDLAEDIADLRSRVVNLAKAREHLPQPLFWSLFHSRVRDIKKHKELTRALDAALGGSSD